MSLRSALGEPKNPALRQHAKERRTKVENRTADRITRFARSMEFVFVHIAWFVVGISSTEQILCLSRSTNELILAHAGTAQEH
jgi:uncharacterized membrane protein